MMAGKKEGDNMKEHILSLSMRARIKRETIKLGRYTIIGKYAYRYTPEAGAIERVSARELDRTPPGWRQIDYTE